jgi:hypothetical protein
VLYTLSDARAACGRFVESGTSKASIIDARINEGLERLLDLAPLECLRRTMRVCTQGRTFALPHNAEKVLFANVNGTPAKVFGQAYQFLDAGPGDDAFRSQAGSYKDLEDLGDNWPYMFSLPGSFSVDDGATCVGDSGWTLAAFSSASADKGKHIAVKGFKPNGETVTDLVPINSWLGGVEGMIDGEWGGTVETSSVLFHDIDRVVFQDSELPTGYVTLYAVDTATQYTYFLAKYHPSVKIPQFRRYRITNHGCSAVSNLLLSVQLRHVPLTEDGDILPVNSIQAVKLAVISLREENQGKLNEARDAMSGAVEILAKREEANTLSGGVPVIVDTLRRSSLENKRYRGMLL